MRFSSGQYSGTWAGGGCRGHGTKNTPARVQTLLGQAVGNRKVGTRGVIIGLVLGKGRVETGARV